MTHRILRTLWALALVAATENAFAGTPFPATSTCTVSITQYSARPGCMANWDPDVVRLTPAGSNAVPVFDRVDITVRVRDAADFVVPGALLRFHEVEPLEQLNIANEGASIGVTDADGLGTVSLWGASGSGRVELCADGVPLCALQVRSPDVTKTSVPTLCGLGTAASSVSGNDINNPACGFLVHFGPVTVGVNDGFDLNCDMNVSGPDINGSLGKGGVLQYFGDVGTLGSQNTCALP